METQNQNAAYTSQKPIINSMLDLDHYKLTMGQFVFRRYADVPVTYAFKNRTKKVQLADVIDESDLRRELDAVKGLRANEDEIQYLRTIQNNGAPLFGEDYLNFLRNPNLPAYKLNMKDGNLQLEFEGDWSRAIYWETFALSVMNELYYRKITDNMSEDERKHVFEEGNRRLEEKVQGLKENPGVRFIEFGTRRRFSKEWQDYVVSQLKDSVPNQIVGTSNVNLARKYGLAPKGTMAHEVFMVMSGIMHKNDDDIRASHNQVLTEWFDEYGKDLSIALTDTYGSEFFFKDMTLEQARNWNGMRQDSGSPANFARKEIDFYKVREIDPKDKLFVPSDGLELPTIVGLQNEFGNRINTVAGWGTNITNDLGLLALSLIVKAVKANGHGTVKLSDNPAKMMGAPEDIPRFMRIFEYDPTKYVQKECKY